MPSYAVPAKEAFVPTELYHPDFNAIGGTLRLRQQQYNTGFDQIKNTYTSLLNAPLTKAANIQDRDRYLQMARYQLQNLPQADLSVPQVVQGANSVFDPIMQDKDLRTDMLWTRNYQSEMEKGLTYRDSKDEDMRNQFWGAGLQYLQNGADQLRNSAKGDFAAYDNRRYIPFKDPVAHLDKAAKDQGLSVDWTDASGPVLWEYKNGKRAQANFKVWAKSQMGPAFDDVFNVLGTVEMEGQVKSYTQQGLSPEMAKAQVAGDYIGRQVKQLSTNVGDYTEAQAKLTKQRDSLFDANGMTKNPQDEAKALEIQKQIDGLGDDIASYNKQLKEWQDKSSPTYQDAYSSVMLAGSRFFGNIYKDTYANNWASGYASAKSSVTGKENQAYSEKIRAEQQYRTYLLSAQREQSEAGLRAAQTRYYNERADRLDGTTEGDGSGLGSTTGTGEGTTGGTKLTASERNRLAQQSPGSGIYQGAAITEVQKVENPEEIFRKSMKDLYSSAMNTRYGALAKILPFLDITLSNGQKVGTSEAIQFKNESFENTTNLTSSGDNSMVGYLSKYYKDRGVDLKTGSPYSLFHAITEDFNAKMADWKDGKSPVPEDLIKAAHDLAEGDSQYQRWNNEFTKFNNQMDKLVADKQTTVLAKNKNGIQDGVNYNNTIVTVDGKKRFAQPEDIKKDFTPVTITLKGSDTPITLSADEQARGFLSNRGYVFAPKDRRDQLYYIDKDGTKKDVKDINFGKEVASGPFAALRDQNKSAFLQAMHGIQDKYGDPEKIAAVKRQIENNAASSLTQYGTQGNIGNSILYRVDNRDGKENFGYELAQNLTNPANRAGYEGPRDEKTDQVLNNLGSYTKYIDSVTYGTIGSTGQPTLTVRFNNEINKKEGNDYVYNQLGLTDKQKAEGITVYLPDTAKGTAIAKLPHPSEFYVYGELLRGKPIQSSPTEEAFNFKYKVIPDNFGSTNPNAPAGSAKIELSIKKFDPEKGWIDQWVPVQVPDIPLVGPNKKTPDEIMATLRNYYYSYMTNTNKQIQDVAQIPQTNGYKGRTLAEIQEASKKTQQ